MKTIGIVVCNYNKREYVVNCIQSILDQSMQDFDIYVVDNASPDDSVEVLDGTFGDKIHLIANKENLGGSGGFNTGIREAIKHDYKYIMLADNDIVMDKKAIENLYQFMEKHPDIGMLGSEILKMDEPEVIMALGSSVDYTNYKYKDCYRSYVITDVVPEVNYCDYVPACSMMVRAKTIRKVGLMTEQNFIYWDDIDWAKRMQLEGDKIAAISSSKVWHKGGATRTINTFPAYYNLRNGIQFFAFYLKEVELNQYIDAMLEQIYAKLYGSYSKGKYNYIETIMFAYDDALHCVRGRAEENRILPMIEEKNFFRDCVENDKKIVIELTDDCSKNDFDGLRTLVEFIEKTWDNKQIIISTRQCRSLTDEISKKLHFEIKRNVILTDKDVRENVEFSMQLCEHVRKVKEVILPTIYVDAYTNTINSEDEMIYFKGYDINLDLFKKSQRKIFMDGVRRIRSDRK